MTCSNFLSSKLSAAQALNILIFLTCIYLYFGSTSHAAEKNQTVLKYNFSGTESWMPYGYYGDDDKPGIFSEVIGLILERAGYSYVYSYYPPKRANQAFEEGKLDLDFMSPSWFKDGDMGDEYVQSDKVFELSEYNVTLTENAKKYADPKSIYGKRVGTVGGYNYFDDDKFTRVDFSSESALIKGLKKGRFEVAILENLTAFYWAKQHNVKISLASVHSHGDIVLRLRKELSYLLPSLNAAIASLKQERAIDKVLQSYNVK